MLARQLSRKVASSIASRAPMSTLVVAESGNNKDVTPGTLSTLTAASKIGEDVTVLVLGSTADELAQNAAKLPGVASVVHAKDAKFDKIVAEEVTELLATAHANSPFNYILAPSSNASKSYMPRLGAKLDAAPLSDIIDVKDKETFVRPTYAGNALAEVKTSDAVKLMTVRATSFEKSAAEGGSASVSDAPESPTFGKTSFVSEEVSQSERPDLSAAGIVISGGRGLKNGENFEMLYKLADKLGGAVGASRAAVDAGYVPNELQVGQTGKVVAPELYVAVGISGAIQHLAGMKDSKTIVAINKDEEAPIFQVADYGLVADLFEAVPDMTEKV